MRRADASTNEEQMMDRNQKNLFDLAWHDRVKKLEMAGPVIAEAKRLVLADAARRGVMNQIQWRDIGLPSGELFPIAPPSFDPPGPGINLDGGGSFRLRR